jgi:hypothetical protein
VVLIFVVLNFVNVVVFGRKQGMFGGISRRSPVVLVATLWLVAWLFAPVVHAQRGRGQALPATNPRAAAPIDLTGYWVSIIVDEWRFRVTPQKGDIAYLPLNPEARKIANAWDPAKDESEGAQCKAYGAVGVMQRPGRLHITWENDMALRLETDAGTQTRLLRFGIPTPRDQQGEPSWQGYSNAQWLVAGRALLDLGGLGFVPGGRNPGRGSARGGTLRVVTTNLRPGYIRKNGVPYSGNAVLTEYMTVIDGQQGDTYLSVTASVEDPTYLTGPFLRTYTFKKLADATGWDPTPCWPK